MTLKERAPGREKVLLWSHETSESQKEEKVIVL